MSDDNVIATIICTFTILVQYVQNATHNSFF
jgi:hypothetical protein